VSPLTSLKRIPPGVGDVPQDRPSGPLLIKPKPASKNSLRKSSRNYAIALELVRALLILTVLGCISDYHVDALPIKKHDTCDLPKFNLKQRWNGVYGKEYEFLISQADKLKERNEEKQKWIDIDSSQQSPSPKGAVSCKMPPEFNECDLKAQKVAKSVQRWMGDFFRRYRRAKKARQAAYKLMKLFDQLLRKSSRLDHRMKDKSERCKEKIYDVYDETLLFTTKEEPTPAFLSRSTRSLLCEDVPTFNLKGKWDLTLGEEYDFLLKETENLKRRNNKKQHWATTDECKLSPPGFESDCDDLFETKAKLVRNWFQRRFDAIPKPSLHPAYKVTEEFKKLLKEKNYLDHQVKEKKKNCDQTVTTETSNREGELKNETSTTNTKVPENDTLSSSSASIYASSANFKIILFIPTYVFLNH